MIEFKDIELYATCINNGGWITEVYNKGARKFSYNKAKKLIKKYLPKIYEELGLDYYNSWEDNTTINKKLNCFHIEHSMIDFIFKYN